EIETHLICTIGYKQPRSDSNIMLNALERSANMTEAIQNQTLHPPPDMADRMTMRSRPAGAPVMHQSWDKLLFLHWEVPAATLRPLIPSPLQIDTYDDK